MASTSTSLALAKRSSDTALMPPPPRPKRIKRPQKVLDEDEYMDALSHIIARDFFPGLMETESQQDYLNALESQDHGWIAAAGRKLTEVMTPGPDGRRLRGRRGTSMTPMTLYGRGEETPKAWQGDTPMSVTSITSTSTNPEKPEVDTNMSLSAFQTKYTSEDNESFYKLLDKQNLKKAEKYAWMWAGNKIPAPSQIAHRKREALLAANKSQDPSSTSKQLIKAPATEDNRKAMPDSWPTNNPTNTFMFDPASIEDSTQTTHQAAEETSRAPPKAVIYDNTRLRLESSTSSDPPPSPSLSAVQEALAGRPRPTASEPGAPPGSSTPRINGYAFVDAAPSPTPSSLGAPPLTWGTIETSTSLLGSGDKTPNPFSIKEGSKREALHHRMVDKVAKGKRSGKRDAGPATPLQVPRFVSSPRVGPGGLTPAGERLLGRVGGRTPGVQGSGSGKVLSGLRQAYTPKM